AIERLTGATLLGGHRIALQLDNAESRESLLAAIDGARERVHYQCYIVNDDDVARSILGALTRAAGRGVAVRVLIDALYTGHHAFGMEHAGLTALGALAGAEVRASRPIDHAPSLEDLKRRDHRKLVVIDGVRALVTGRNTGNEYYRSWHEVALGATSPWREVPWLDAGAWLEGPVVENLEAMFSAAWCAAGGEPIAVRPVPPAGDVSLRLVVHRGLEDAFTLETYRVLIDAAQRDLTIVNSFPLTFELLNALLRARERGVRVRLLFGSPRPYHDGGSFPGGSWRDLANELVRGRVVGLIAAGAEAFEFAVGAIPGWEPALGKVRAAVHSKLLVVDGRVSVMGSANLDVTASYWESELLLVIHDEGVAGALLAAFDGWCVSSFRVDATAPEWSTRIERREWLSRNWPTWIG
ncbi:MAG: phosphatidylserine/phosphatidylglycerophosphate/cardiolipin synthase family protein, partial [Deltaproteobacteria bacterium]